MAGSKTVNYIARKSAVVVRNVLYPKNILVIPDSPGRVVLTDFDLAILPKEGPGHSDSFS
jgi:hypothetical protein